MTFAIDKKILISLGRRTIGRASFDACEMLRLLKLVKLARTPLCAPLDWRMILPTRVELSASKHLPVLRVYRRTFYPHQFVHRMISLRSWRILQKNPPIVDIDGQILTLSPRYFDTLFGEWPSWKKVYLPKFSLRDLTVLDIGAGCGETALFFLSQGTKKVICVEPDPGNMEMLQSNASRNGWNVEMVLGRFEPAMLGWKFDYMKMDCEGCERTILNLESLPPCVIEVHDPHTHRAFIEKFHVSTVEEDKRGTWIVQTQ